MGVRVEPGAEAVRVSLSGWDRLMNWRRSVDFERESIRAANVARRSELESQIQHRALGIGTHDGSKRIGHRRVGSMMGRSVIGKQFWAATAGAADADLLVLDLVDHEFVRAVIEVDRPESVATNFSPGGLNGATQLPG